LDTIRKCKRFQTWYALLMRLLGIDYGTKKIGLALTDDKGTMAFPHGVIPNNGEVRAYIGTLVKKEGVDEIVIGHSLNKEGKPNTVHAAVEELIGDLTLDVGIPIHLEPEQYSTQEAIRIQGRNAQTDASAATIILNSFLERRK
jgi:putative Holliday junction resolvase